MTDSQSLIELKACPFCAKPSKVFERNNPMSKWRWSVDCSTCGMSGPVEDSKAAAIEAWNTRVPSPPVELEGVEEARDVLQRILDADREAPGFGLSDCVDNAGEHYQSADLAAVLIAARKIVAASPPAKPVGKVG